MDFFQIPRMIAKFLHSLVVLALLALILPAALLTALGLVQDTDTPMLGPWCVVPVQDDAMAPALEKGDLVLLRARDTYAMQTLVACVGEDGPLLGRVMRWRDGGYTLGYAEGDEVRAMGVPPAKMLGAQALRIPVYGGLLNWAMTGFGMFALLCVGILLAELPRFITAPQDDEDEDDEE